MKLLQWSKSVPVEISLLMTPWMSMQTALTCSKNKVSNEIYWNLEKTEVRDVKEKSFCSFLGNFYLHPDSLDALGAIRESNGDWTILGSWPICWLCDGAVPARCEPRDTPFGPDNLLLWFSLLSDFDHSSVSFQGSPPSINLVDNSLSEDALLRVGEKGMQETKTTKELPDCFWWSKA